jgi:hypothetical protein
VRNRRGGSDGAPHALERLDVLILAPPALHRPRQRTERISRSDSARCRCRCRCGCWCGCWCGCRCGCGGRALALALALALAPAQRHGPRGGLRVAERVESGLSCLVRHLECAQEEILR